MPPPPDRQTRKRLATRQAISDTATRLFFERGFDNVTIDEIAEAADVGRMTVFNHFPRKEDMFFDLDAQAREMLREALQNRPASVAPLEALRRLCHRILLEDCSYISFSLESQRFVETVEKSPALLARARAIRDEVADFLTVALAESVGREPTDPDAELAAHLLLSTWTVAFLQAHRAYRESRDAEKAKSTFLALIDRGTLGLEAATAGTPYTQASVKAVGITSG